MRPPIVESSAVVLDEVAARDRSSLDLLLEGFDHTALVDDGRRVLGKLLAHWSAGVRGPSSARPAESR
jgi:hypothetical protein